MVPDYKTFLAENILNERRTVTYRLLSRALRVHCSLAKQMLYEFRRSENIKKSGSVNATYIITGIQKPSGPLPSSNNKSARESIGDDEILQSSPYLSSSMPGQDTDIDMTASSSIILCREEDLEEARSIFQSISSIYIYSLQSATLQDLNVLTDASRELSTTYGNEDPLEFGKQWGLIQNDYVKRRTGPPAPRASTAVPPRVVPAKRPLQEDQPPKGGDPKEGNGEEGTQERGQDPTARQSRPMSAGTSSKLAAQVAPKKGNNNLLNSFAKAKLRQNNGEPATPTGSEMESTKPSDAMDVVLDDSSGEEAEELFPNRTTAQAPSRETRRQREEKLRKMMEDDDDEDIPDPTQPPASTKEATTLDRPSSEQPELKMEATVSGGRRRGKRQVMKKKTIKDEEGYLVTVDEPTWESFSEDEPAPKIKSSVNNIPKGKPAGKAGQGNIMSFFSKK